MNDVRVILILGKGIDTQPIVYVGIPSLSKDVNIDTISHLPPLHPCWFKSKWMVALFRDRSTIKEVCVMLFYTFQRLYHIDMVKGAIRY